MCDECKRGILPNKTFWECKKTNYCICDRYPRSSDRKEQIMLSPRKLVSSI